MSRTKLLPSLYRLHIAGRLPADIVILCIGRRAWDTAHWREEVTRMLGERMGQRLDTQQLPRFLDRLQYFLGDPKDPEASQRLRDSLEQTPGFPSNFVFYLPLPPTE